MKKLVFLFAAFLLVAAAAQAQIRTPQPSPGAELKQTVGLSEISIVYSRPSMKGRAVFAANGLVPFGQTWRTGANSATKVTFSDDVKVAGSALKKGSYAILTVPNATEWSVMFYTYDSGNFGSYLEKKPDATVTVKSSMLSDKVESFTMGVSNITNNSAHIDIMWEKTKVSIPVEVEVDSRVSADIERVMAGPSSNDYYAAATYYHEAGKDLKKAHEWIKKANATNPQYWMLRRQSLIEADLGMYKEATATAEMSLKKAEEAKNNDYIKMNKESIAEWSKKK